METLIVLWIECTEMVEIKHKEFIDVVPIVPCQNPLWIMDSRIYGEGRTQIPQFTCYDRSFGRRSTIDKVYADIKIANNIKINHIIISLLIFVMLFLLTDSPQKLKLEKILDTLKTLSDVMPSFPQLQGIGFFY